MGTAEKLRTIDADSHILEGEHTWDFLEPHEQKYRPVLVEIPTVHGSQSNREDQERKHYWVADFSVLAASQDGRIPAGIREMTDVRARLEKMDELGIDVQVVYPTIFLVRPTDQPEALLALSRSYNRFMAEACRQSGNRLRWIMVPPIETLQECLAELEFGKKHGACGVLVQGIEGNRVLSNPYFLPLFEKAASLDLAICCHVGAGNKTMVRSFPSAFFSTRSPVLTAFHDLLLGGIPDRFPTLRFGFIEAGAQWVPYVISEVRRRSEWISKQKQDDRALMRSKRLFVSCRIDDDIPYLLQWAGKHNLVTGTDYGHDDYSTDILAFRELRSQGGDKEALDGILGGNAAMLYGL